MSGCWLVVLTWHGREDTLRLLPGLLAEPATVLVVDNGSGDGVLEAVRERHPAAHTLQTGANLGYAGGMNRGVRHALDHGASVVGVLNNDTTVEPGFLAPLLDALDGPPRAVSPDIRYLDDPAESWFRGARVEDARPVHVTGRGPLPDRPFASDFLTGCALLAPAAVWRRVGPFDERLFLIFEDGDWSARARAAGVELLVVPRSRIAHGVSRSFTGTAGALGGYYFARNGTVFAWRHLGRRAALRFAAEHVLRPALRDVRARRGSVLLPLLGVLAAAGGRRGRAGRFVTALARRAAR